MLGVPAPLSADSVGDPGPGIGRLCRSDLLGRVVPVGRGRRPAPARCRGRRPLGGTGLTVVAAFSICSLASRRLVVAGQAPINPVPLYKPLPGRAARSSSWPTRAASRPVSGNRLFDDPNGAAFAAATVRSDVIAGFRDAWPRESRYSVGFANTHPLLCLAHPSAGHASSSVDASL